MLRSRLEASMTDEALDYGAAARAVFDAVHALLVCVVLIFQTIAWTMMGVRRFQERASTSAGRVSTVLASRYSHLCDLVCFSALPFVQVREAGVEQGWLTVAADGAATVR
jgi:hypothetical protein